MRTLLTTAAVAGIGLAGLAATATGAGAAVPVAGTYHPMDPVRVMDTRDGTGVTGTHPGPLGAGEVRELQVTGANGVPADGVGAVTVNVTVTDAEGPGYVTVYPCGRPRPYASNVNYVRGVDVANEVTAKVGAGGKVCFFSSRSLQLVVDQQGWWSTDVATVPGVHFSAVEPARVLDTRDGTGVPGGATGPLPAGQVLALTVAGAGGVPADARAVTLNVTGTDATSAGYLTVFPCGAPRPGSSTLNLQPGADVANLVTARVGSAGQVCLYASVTTDVVADLQGFFDDHTPVRAAFVPADPVRILDTRDGTGIAATRRGPLGAGEVIEVQVRGANGVPADARAVLLNVTVTDAEGPGFVTVFPCGHRPWVSNVNLVRGVDRANSVRARIGDDGRVCFFTSRSTDLVADQSGWFVPAA